MRLTQNLDQFTSLAASITNPSTSGSAKKFHKLWLLIFITIILMNSKTNLRAQITSINIAHTNDGGIAQGIALSGNYIFLASGSAGLQVYDISNPYYPLHLAQVTNIAAQSVAVSGNYAYVAAGSAGLHIYDISNPSAPVSIGQSSTNYGGSALRLVVSGNYAYVANSIDGLRIFDVSTPSNPVNVGHWSSGSTIQGWAVAVSGNYVYLACYADALHVLDVSNPANPVNVSQITTNNSIVTRGLTVSGNYLYLGNNFDGLRIYDVSNPTNPASMNIGAHDNKIAWDPFGVTVSGSFAYLDDGGDGVRIYDVSNPTNPTEVAHIKDGGSAQAMAVANNRIYLANSTDGLRVYVTKVGLRLESYASNSLRLSWPAISTNLLPQQNTDISSQNWISLTNTPTTVSNRNQVIIPSSNDHVFFRLTAP